MRGGQRMGAVVAALACWAGLAASSASAADWAQFRFTAAQSGANPAETVLTPTSVGALQQRWAAAIGSSIDVTAPLVLGDETVVSGSEQATVAALRTATGAPLWTFHGATGFASNPIAAGGGRLFVSTDRGPLYTLSVSTGALLWKRALGGSFGGGATVANGVVYVPGSGRVFALDAATGRTLWSTPLTPGAVNLSTPAVSSGLVLVGAVDAVWALRATTGRVAWRHPFTNGRGTGVAIVGGAAYASGGRRLVRLELGTGRVVWGRTLPDPVVASPAVSGGLVFVHTETQTVERLTARSAATGKLVWSSAFPHGGTFGVVESCPGVAAGVVYLGFTDGHLRAFRSTTGDLLASLTLDGPVVSSPSIANGQVEIGTLTGTLYAFSVP